MKKFVKFALASAVAVAASCAMAQPTENNHAGYAIRGMNEAKTAAANEMLYPQTDMTVINASTDAIYLVLPIQNNPPVVTFMQAGPGRYNPAHITNPGGAFYTTIDLQNMSGMSFFKQTLCPRALIVIFGGYGSYNVSVDDEYCR